MASISQDRNTGLKTIQFVADDGKRKSVRLGSVPMKTANEVKARVEQLLACILMGTSHDADLCRWLTNIGDELAERLASVGLIAGRLTMTLDKFLEAYTDDKAEIVKGGTAANFKYTWQHLTKYFGGDCDIRRITAGDAEDFANSLRKHQAEATVSRNIRRCRQFFSYAVKKDLLTKNPFSEVRVGTERNDERRCFVSRETFAAVMEHVTDPQLRLALAAGRFAGMRVPSEILSLRWDHVDWDKKRILIHSPKLEKDLNGGKRWCPIFGDFAPYLEEAFENAEAGAIYAIPNGRETNLNQIWRKALLRAVERAGLLPWPRIFHALRGSCESELVQEFPITTISKWLGHSVKVASEHYVSVTESDYEKAATRSLQSGAESGAVGAKTVHFAVQSATAGNGQERTQDIDGSGVSQFESDEDDSMTFKRTTRLGFEPRQRVPKTLVLPLHYRVMASIGETGTRQMARDVFKVTIRRTDGKPGPGGTRGRG